MDDLINRQEVLEQINCWIGSGEYRYTNATEYLIKRIKDITLKDSLISRQEVINLINLRLAHLEGCKPPKEMGFIDGVRDGYCRIRSDVTSMLGSGINVPTKTE